MKNCFLVILIFVLLTDLFAQEKPKYPDELSAQFQGLKFRNIGPYRGGRSNAVAGIKDDIYTYYMGSTGGGVFKTTDGGNSWKNVSDGYFKTGSVGAIDVADSDPNIVYAGMGEHAVRGVMTSSGDGIYKSTDAGKTWNHMGLPQAQHISRIRIHPNNPDLVYVAVQGVLYGPNAERGIYQTKDGGKTWQKILYLDVNTGASDLSMDIHNPRILYASMWDHRRFPWKIRSGGPGSGIYKSMDGGANWEKLEKGLPAEMGKVAVDVSPANPEIVYANIEAKEGGVYMSVDAGKSWKRVCSDRITIARAWYYIEIFADPQNENTVYVMNAPFLKSIDGGKTFTPIAVPHGDQHDLWINPDHNQVLINANDGGANVSFDGGKSWSRQDNQCTAQFYRVITDNQFPYRIYAGQQDNTTVSIASRTNGSAIGNKDWTRSAGGESAFLAFDKNNPTIIYGGSYQGNISAYDIETQIAKDIMAYPVIGLGSLPADMKYRFNWNAPIVASPQNPEILYHAGNKVLRSSDGGMSWNEISPDLTKNEKDKQGPGGEPYTNEGAGGENYNTISYLAASPHQKGLLYVGTDDGLVQITRDEGQNWQNITPDGLGDALINTIEVSPHDPAKVVLACTKYRFNDQQPYIYMSEDYGQTWNRKNKGIDKNSFVRVVREDRIVENLFYAGTERGLYVSHNGGDDWYPMQLNLPVSPINDMTIRDNDLIVATSGRAFWILDDLASLQAFARGAEEDKIHLFAPKISYKYGLNASPKPSKTAGQNPLPGVILDYYLPEDMDSSEIKLVIIDQDEDVIRTYQNKKSKEHPDALVLKSKKGVNRTYWDLRKNPLPKVKGLKLLQSLSGHTVCPGIYRAKLYVDQDSFTVDLTIMPYQKIGATEREYQEQYDFLNTIENTFTDVVETVNKMNSIKSQLSSQKTLLKEKSDIDDLVGLNDSIVGSIDAWLENLIQPKQKTFQDIINFPNQLNAELLDLIGRSDGMYPQITEGSKLRLNDLQAEWQIHKRAMEVITEQKLQDYMALYRRKELPIIIK